MTSARSGSPNPMTTRHDPQQPETSKSADRHTDQNLAVLTRANHDMRSPLSVVLGVFELLDGTSNLSDSERRYLQLGIRAAEELLALADGLRLYSAMERQLLNLEATRVNLAELARARLERAFGADGVSVQPASTPAPADARVLADEGYLDVALEHLIGHLADRLPESDHSAPSVISLQHCLDDEDRVMLQMALVECRQPLGHLNCTPSEGLAVDDVNVLNAVRLIETMGGVAEVPADQPRISIALPAAFPQGA